MPNTALPIASFHPTIVADRAYPPSMPRRFDRLNAQHVIGTVDRLERRIGARFEGRGLHRVAGELRELSEEVATVSSDARLHVRSVTIFTRIAMLAVVVVTGTAVAFAARGLDEFAGGTLAWVTLLESAINDLVFAAIALYFLYALPSRVVRGRLLAVLHRLRSLAHIVDMHQLTKDPERLRPDFVCTDESVSHDLDRAEMEHYLDYCSELLACVGKVAALCAEESQDSVVLNTVASVETLTTDMSRKIWQKISLLPK